MPRLRAWTLFRLWRFAKPYSRRLLGGLGTDLAGHRRHPGAALSNHAADGQGADPVSERRAHRFHKVMLLLGGLLGAAFLAWILDWAKTYILALVSERIGSDLRTTTYEHLQGLSLEYFGGKRTGDLMARISSGSDRICVFLSIPPVGFRHRPADDPDDLRDPGFHQSMAGPGDLASAALHRMADPRGARQAPPWLRSGLSDLVGGHQRAGRHDSRHPRGQGLRPGKTRGAALPRGQRPQPRRQRPRQQGVVAVHADRHVSNRSRPAGRLGLRNLAGLATPRSRSACWWPSSPTSTASTRGSAR